VVNETDETRIVFGEHGKLREMLFFAPPQSPQKTRSFIDELFKVEYAILIGFMSFITKGVFELPKIDSSTPYDYDELIEELKDRFLWPGIDPVMPYETSESIGVPGISIPGYCRLKIPTPRFSIVDIYLSFCGGGGDTTYLSGYKQEAKELIRKETYKVLQIPSRCLEEPEGKLEEIERILAEKNLIKLKNGESNLLSVIQKPSNH